MYLYNNNFWIRIKSVLKNYCQQFVRNLPFRMMIRKFGIWLMKVGHVLQTRYANWNSEFRLETEYHNHPHMVTLNVSELITDMAYLTFSSPLQQQEKQTPLVKALFRVKGIKEVNLSPYTIHLHKGGVFSWSEILPEAEKIILKALANA